MSKQFMLGSSKKIITPPLGTPLYGYTTKRPASSVNDDLTVTAVACEQDGLRGVIISADICSVTEQIVDTMREKINKETNIPKENISFSATHTHSGPAIKSSGGWGVANTEYINGILIPQTVSAAVEASKNMVPAVMGVGTTTSLVGINRREIDEDGKVLLGQNPFGVCDTTMTVLAFKDLNGKNILNMVHYSCHGTSAGRCTKITRDWPGIMVDALELQSGATSVFFNGSEGDMGPRISNGSTTGETGDVDYVNEIGNLAAIDAVRAFRSIKDFTEVDFGIIKGVVKLPYKPIPTLEEATAKLAKLDAQEQLIEVDFREHAVLQETIKMHKENAKFDDHMHIDQVMFKFNSTVFVPFPFELFSEIALRLRAYSPFQNTLCTCNTNGSHFYLPTQTEMARGGYEIEIFLYATLYKLQNNTDDTIIKENLRLMREYLKNK